MQVLVEIPDNKAAFGLEVLRNLAFVKKIDTLSGEKNILIQEVKEAVDNLILVKQGKLKAKPARELLDEL
jgi:polyhydroxyalkanoate synthesis regulator phasin